MPKTAVILPGCPVLPGNPGMITAEFSSFI
jgi:hypothetical protein